MCRIQGLGMKCPLDGLAKALQDAERGESQFGEIVDYVRVAALHASCMTVQSFGSADFGRRIVDRARYFEKYLRGEI